jgi:glycosyltransferase involved in cell wall biosynthesis
MKILHLNNSDTLGGSAIAMQRLHTGLQQLGVDSNVLVMEKLGQDPKTFGPRGTWSALKRRLVKKIEALPNQSYPQKTASTFYAGWRPSPFIHQSINAHKADIVHIHWVSAGMANISSLLKIHAPIVWTLHDMWPFTGGCHYDDGCGGYLHQCQNCQVLNSSPCSLSHWGFKHKQQTYGQNDLHFHAISSWLRKTAQASQLLKNKKIQTLGHPIDTESFSPLPQLQCKKELGWPTHKKIILMIADRLISDPRKGFQSLCSAIGHLQDISSLEIVLVGENETSFIPELNVPYQSYGPIRDQQRLLQFFSACDVVVCPSRQEAFGLVPQEAMSCGKPVVGYSNTGLEDLIDHLDNGYLAVNGCAKDLAKGLEWALNTSNIHELQSSARKKIIDHFSHKKIIPKYIDMYLGMISGNKR